jgi:hypothetical protein
MAKPIVKSFVIDTTKSEQNLKNLDATTAETTAQLEALYDELIALDAQLEKLDPNTQAFTEVNAKMRQLENTISNIEVSNVADLGNAIEGAVQPAVDLNEQIDELNNSKLGGAGDDFKDICDATNCIGDEAEEASDKLDDAATSTKKLGQNAKGAESGFKKVGSTLNGLVKATGVVALLTAAFNTIKSVISSTQPIADAFSAAFGTFTDIIRDAFTYISDNAGTVIEYFQAIFNDPVQSLKDFGNAIVENLIERFNSFVDTLGFISDGIKNLFSGEFDAALESFKSAGKESIDVLTGVNNTVDRVSDAVVQGAEAFANYVGETYKANVALVALQNNAKLAAAQQARLAEQYDREAELLRQIRDDESKSIQDRIDANTKLGEVLKKQEEAELAAAQAQVAAAQATFNHNKTIDNQVALTQSLAEVDAVRAKIAGLKSEQLVNEIALNKELNELYKAQQQSAAELAINEAKFAADSIKNDIERLNAQREVLEQEKTIQLQRLQGEIDKYKEGTQARLDAEIEYNTLKQQLDQNLTSNTIALKEAENARLIELNRLAFENEIGSIDNKIAALNAEYAEKAKLYANDAVMLEAIEKEKQRKILAIEQETKDAKLLLASDTLGAIGNLAAAFAKGDEKRAKAAFKIQKAVSIAQATVDTYKGANAIFANAAINPATILFPAQPFIAAGIAIASGLANVATIAQQQFQGGSSSGGSSGSVNPPSLPGDGGASQPAQFNPLAASFLQDRPEQITPRAYVLASDVASAAETRQRVEDLARLG